MYTRQSPHSRLPAKFKPKTLKSRFPAPGMSKPGGRFKPSAILSDGFLFLSGALVALLLVFSLWSFSNPHDPFPSFSFPSSSPTPSGPDLLHDPPDPTFYDDPDLRYSFSRRSTLSDWDEKRHRWLRLHPSFSAGAGERVLMLTGSQPKPCKNPVGDHLLLRLFKNKVDYARIHGYEIFYNNLLLDKKMFSFWAKYPVVRAAMIAHPEAEWIWWVDSDAVITDMEFKLPLHRYKDHNLVVHGWENLVYGDPSRRSWVGINAGVFLIRNCQWSIDLMERWISMGPSSPNYPKWGEIQKSVFPDKLYPESDDQTGLLYLMVKEREKFGARVYIESEFYFEGYWVEIVGKLKNTTAMYAGMERKERALRRRHAEKVTEAYAAKREPKLEGLGYGKESWRRPFITHFTGCQPCNGKHNEMYTGNSCWDGMEMALNFADNQVLRNFGFVHPDLLSLSRVEPLPFDFPGSDDDDSD